MSRHSFRATLEIIGVNPFVFVPGEVLAALHAAAGRDRGPIPVRGLVDGAPFTQTLVRYQGHWRLYVNTTMLKDSPRHVGRELAFEVEHDPEPRTFEAPEAFVRALAEAPRAAEVLAGLPPSRRTEIVRYLARLKSQEALERNIPKAIAFLEGKGRFAGRDRP